MLLVWWDFHIGIHRTYMTDKAHALIYPDTHAQHFYPYHRYKMLAACIVCLAAPTGRPNWLSPHLSTHQQSAPCSVLHLLARFSPYHSVFLITSSRFGLGFSSGFTWMLSFAFNNGFSAFNDCCLNVVDVAGFWMSLLIAPANSAQEGWVAINVTNILYAFIVGMCCVQWTLGVGSVVLGPLLWCRII